MLDTILGEWGHLRTYGAWQSVRWSDHSNRGVKGVVPGMTQTVADVPTHVNETDVAVCCPGTTQNHTVFSENREFLRNLIEYI